MGPSPLWVLLSLGRVKGAEYDLAHEPVNGVLSWFLLQGPGFGFPQ